MNCTRCRFVFAGAAALVIVGASLGFAQNQPDKPAKPAAPSARAPQAPKADDAPQFQLPPGWTEADLQACEAAGTPGEMHAYLREGIGVWKGKQTMWMAPGAPPMEGEVTNTITPMFDGRYVRCEVEGDMMGQPFRGIGVYGFDNASQSFQSTWIDNHSTGIMIGSGERSSDGTTMTWAFDYTCPVTKKPAVMREVETRTGPDAMTFEMFGTDPKSGKEFQVMVIEYERQPGTAPGTRSGAAPGREGARPANPGNAAPGMLSDKKAEAGCGLCSYHMPGVESCTLAVKVDGKSYLVTGSDVDVHQFCGSKGPKPATVTGKIIDGKFVATDIKVQTATR